jgi:hypothetical protein
VFAKRPVKTDLSYLFYKEKKRQAKFGCAGVTKSKPANKKNRTGKTQKIIRFDSGQWPRRLAENG